MKSFFTTLILFTMTTAANAQIPAGWAQHTVMDTINVPLENYWVYSFALNLEDIGSAGKYKDLPRIVKTSPVSGDFTEEGHSRRVHFHTGETLLESIILMKQPFEFAYELTEIELALKRAAKRARGYFRYSSLPGGKTKVEWTYGFEQKNFFVKMFLQRYIKKTHSSWMKDTLTEMKRQSEKMFKEGKQ